MPRRAHYLDQLKSDNIPGRHIVFDCETRLQERAGKRAHYWACGAAAKVERGTDEDWRNSPTIAIATAAELWERVAAEQPRTGKLVVWAHNLSFDLRISEALRYLPQEGYDLEAIVLER